MHRPRISRSTVVIGGPDAGPRAGGTLRSGEEALIEGRTSDPSALLRALSRGLDEREGAAPRARPALDADLLDVVGRLRAQLQETLLEEGMGQAPRAISASYACALFSQPVPSALFADPDVDTSAGTALRIELAPPDAPVVLAPDALKDVFRLRDWELDDLREEIDRRVGHLLKQQRALRFLWARFGLPGAGVEALFRALFPAAPARLGPIGFATVGAQLYAIVEIDPEPPPSALYLPWMAAPEAPWSPGSSFDASKVDGGLRSAIARAVGADDAEVVAILDAMVTVIPRGREAQFLEHDAWRIRGMGATTTLGWSYRDGAWLARSLAPEEIEVGPWLAVRDDVLVITDAEAAFDRLAIPRVSTMTRQLYAELLARLYRERPTDSPAPRVDDMELYHLRQHVQRVLDPLVEWAGSEATARYVATKLGVPTRAAVAALRDVQRAWRERGDRFWWGAPSKAQRHTVRGALMLHVLCTHDTLRQAHRRPDRWVWPFRDLMLLFAAHWFAEGNLVASVVKGEHDAWRADPIARWFWGLWSDVLDTIETDVSTWSGPHPLD